jgi:hypothetical protein
MSTDTEEARTGRGLRILVAVVMWLGMFAWSNIPPFRGNVLEQPRKFFVWHWKLYSRSGEGICDVRYFDMKRDGEPIERWKLFGYERPGLMPEPLARSHKKELFTDYRRVCHALRKQGVRQPEVEVRARCAYLGKWVEVERRRRNVCTIGAKPKSKTKSKPTSQPRPEPKSKASSGGTK